MSFSYDNFSRVLSAAQPGHTLSYGYDSLGRLTSAQGPLGIMSYQYDAAGRRTRVIWPDAFYVQYEYDGAGAVAAIREQARVLVKLKKP